MKQLVPTGLDEYIAEHKEGDVVTGRIMDAARAELGEGIHAVCRAAAAPEKKKEEPRSEGKADLSSLGSMLQARWKSGSAPAEAKAEPTRTGEVRSFRITKLDPASKKIEVELA
jgi:small subunit ribosomal protein S1